MPQAIYGLYFGDILLLQAIYRARFRDTVARSNLRIYGLCFGDIQLLQAIYTARFRDTVARIFHSVHTAEFNLETDVLRAPTMAGSCFVVICSQGAWGWARTKISLGSINFPLSVQTKTWRCGLVFSLVSCVKESGKYFFLHMLNRWVLCFSG